MALKNGRIVRPWIKSNKRARHLKVAYSARRDGICRICGIVRSWTVDLSESLKRLYIVVYPSADHATFFHALLGCKVARMEFRKGCPACEHTDPQLERELEALAELLFESYLENHGISVISGGIDNAKVQGRLKGVDTIHKPKR